jgi:hypothetical protein
MRLTDKKPLGYTRKKELNNGDLVSWKNWMIKEKQLTTVVSYGTILDIIVKMRGQREVYIAQILCSNTGTTIEVNLLRLVKEETI